MLAGLAVCTGTSGTRADDGLPPASNPYLGISERNIFHLNPPPAPPDPVAAKLPPPKLFLTGICTLGGVKRALLKAAAQPGAKGPDAGKEQSYTIVEGTRADGIDVMEIDERAGTVKVRFENEVSTLNFKDNAVATANPVNPAPGAPPAGAPGFSPGRPVVPGPVPPGARGFTPGMTGMGAGANPPAAMNSLGGTSAPGIGGGMPGAMGAFAGGPGTTGPVMPGIPSATATTPAMTAEEQAVLIELNRETLKATDPGAPPFPPTLLTEGLNAANQENPVPTPGGALPTPIFHGR